MKLLAFNAIDISLGIMLLILFVGVLILIFEVWMFVHVLQNNQLAPEVRALWAIGMLLLHPFVAIAYYFVEYRKPLQG